METPRDVSTSAQSLLDGSSGSGQSVLVSAEFDNKTIDVIASRILIGVGDCTQRLCMDRQVKLSKVTCLFIPSLAPHNISGLPGMILELSRLGVEKVDIFGPRGLKAFVDASQAFCSRQYPKLILREFATLADVVASDAIVEEEGGWVLFEGVDKFFDVRVRPICVDDDSASQEDASVIAVSGLISLKSKYSGLNKKKKNVYIISCTDPVSFNVRPSRNAFERQVTRWCQLTNHSVTSSIRYAISVHCDAVDCKGLDEDRVREDNNVKDHECKVTSGFGTILSYLGVKEGAVELIHAEKSRKALQKLCPALFSEPHVVPIEVQNGRHAPAKAANDNHIAAQRLRKLLAPSSKTPHRQRFHSISSLPNLNSEYLTKDERLLLGISPPSALKDELRVTFLGTGCATPSKFRNGSSVLLQIPKPSRPTALPGNQFSEYFDSVGVMLDVAEGTAAQLYRLCGGSITALDRILLQLRIIWISHSHADHLCGVPALLELLYMAKHRQRRRQFQEPKSNPEEAADMDVNHDAASYLAKKVTVIAPPGVLEYFQFACISSGLEDLVNLVSINRTIFAGDKELINAASEGTVTAITSVPVFHCRHSFGVVLSLACSSNTAIAPGLKLVYSGDCRPSMPLITAGMHCDLLIHEATFDSSRFEDAIEKRHCTTSEAAQVSMSMRAKHTILTHFSQRYPVMGPCVVANEMTEKKRKIRDISCEPAVPPPPPPTKLPYAIAFDFLSFSFPSQASTLSEATNSLSILLSSSPKSKSTSTEQAKEGTLCDDADVDVTDCMSAAKGV